MATKHLHAAADGESQGVSGAAGAPQTVPQAGGQLAKIAEASALLYSATEAIQQINLQLTQRAALRQQQMAERLRQTSSPGEMMALGSGMFTSTLQEAAQYWQDMAAAALKMNTGLLEHSTLQTSQASEIPAVTPAQSTNPALQAWQNLFMAPMNAFNSATHH